jgi:hypothetical protein
MLFENENDRSNEQAIADRMQLWLKERKNRQRTFNKMPAKSVIDFAICAGRTVTGYLECKARTFNSDRFSNVMIDHSKLIQLLEYASWSTVPVWLAVSYTDDRLFLYRIEGKVREDILETRWLQRTSPRVSADNKPVVLLDRSKFIAIR